MELLKLAKDGVVVATSAQLMEATNLSRSPLWLARGILVRAGLLSVVESRGNRAGSSFTLSHDALAHLSRIGTGKGQVKDFSGQVAGTGENSTYGTALLLLNNGDRETTATTTEPQTPPQPVPIRDFSGLLGTGESGQVGRVVVEHHHYHYEVRSVPGALQSHGAAGSGSESLAGTTAANPAARSAALEGFSAPAAPPHPANSNAPISCPDAFDEAAPWVRAARKLAAKKPADQSDYFLMQLLRYPEPTRRRALQATLLRLAEGGAVGDAVRYTLTLAGRDAGHEGGSWEVFNAELAKVKPKATKTGSSVAPGEALKLNTRGPSKDDLARMEAEYERMLREEGRA